MLSFPPVPLKAYRHTHTDSFTSTLKYADTHMNTVFFRHLHSFSSSFLISLNLGEEKVLFVYCVKVKGEFLQDIY